MRPPSPDASAAAGEHADLAACRALLAGGSKTFYAASHALPSPVRDAATALYAFCRLADDAVDLGTDPQAALDALHARLARAYAGTPAPIAADRAFARVVAAYAIPRELPAALLEGFAWDAAGRQYETLDDLQGYAARVAGTVGAMMALLMEARAPAVIARACDLGVAMQLTNIARDVGEDARNGRLYLPHAWLREAGIDPAAWLRAPEHSAAVAAVIARLLAAADTLYRRAAAGIDELPGECRPGMHAARLLYAEIGREVERGGYDAVSRRAVVSRGRKAWLLLGAAAAALWAHPADTAAPLAATRFIVDAVARHPAPVAAVAPVSPLGGKLLWVLDLFERLERREEQLAHAAYARHGATR